ncbi:MAG TPA: aldo/keto reductase [Spirochaetia bacterium]|nr:aldo/keto reductase [Spirochaetia bacterium]
MSELKWGILGTGAIASAFARGLTQTDSGRLYAVGSRSIETANKFPFEAERRYGSYDELLSDPEVQAVYISTPHPFHAEWAVRAAEAGKHILCEKPVALNHGQAMAMIETARENGVFFMEAFMYRCHPQTARIIELVRSGKIGEVRMIRTTFGFGGGSTIDPRGRLFDPSLGGGAILDIGCYPISMARLIAGAAQAKEIAEPVDFSGTGHRGATGVDEWNAATLRFDGDIVAQVAGAVRVTLDNGLEIAGSEGSISVPNPWVINRTSAEAGRILLKVKGETTTIDVPADRTSYAYEADRVARAIEAGADHGEYPAMSPADSLGNIAALDLWREAVGVTYAAEQEQEHRPVRGVLRRCPKAPMKYGTIPGLGKQVSKMIMGCDNQRSFAHGAAMWDDWYERGGNAFDTAWGYGHGIMEQLLGKWMKARNVRDELVVLTKGAHTPRCFPDLLVQDFHESLSRLQTDYADLYIMHRDNPDVPVGEFVDALSELKDGGYIRGVFGGSNWSRERFEEANRYAAAHGRHRFTVLSNNLSLARMVKPVWNGCVHVSDSGSRTWIAASGITNFAWSSQARGYFLPEGERMKLGADNFASWDAEDNRARRARAEELARKKGCSPINIAAAYVLNQPFPSFALVGPRTIHETATTLPALDILLTQDEISWLWGEDTAVI